MTDTDRPEVDDPRVLALAQARQQMAHENQFNAGFCPPWDGLTGQEQRLSLLDARNYLRAALKAGLLAAPAVVLPAPAARAAVLRELASSIQSGDVPFSTEAAGAALKNGGPFALIAYVQLAIGEHLRRMADEAQQPETPVRLAAYQTCGVCKSGYPTGGSCGGCAFNARMAAEPRQADTAGEA
jgi:hypothetical protein